MAVSKRQSRAVKVYKQNTRANSSVKGLTSIQFKHVIEDFYEFARKKGFYRTRKGAIENGGFFIFQWQQEIGMTMLRSLFMQEDVQMSISILRQVGKTEFVGFTVAYILRTFYHTFNRPIDIAIIAPEKDVACIPFERISKYLDDLPDSYFEENTKKRIRTITGDSIKIFGIYDEWKGSTIEGNSFDIVIRDEAHKGSDKKFKDEVVPAMGMKKGCLVMIGNGGFRDCEFKKAIERGNCTTKTKWGDKENVLVKYTYTDAKKYFEQLASDGLQAARTRLSKIEAAIEEDGLDDLQVRKNYFCEWMTEYGNPVTREQLLLCHDNAITFDKNRPEHLYMGLDIATLHDRTVATIMNEKRQIVDWIVLKDANEQMNLFDQCVALAEICSKKGYMNNLVALGFDATGMGSGGVNEFLEEVFMCDLIPYTFTAKAKHEWYSAGIESIKTKHEQDRISFRPDHLWAKQFQLEWSYLEQRELKTMKYKQFGAPNLTGHYDDMVASFCLCFNVLISATNMYTLKMNKDWEEDYDDEDDEINNSPLCRYIG